MIRKYCFYEFDEFIDTYKYIEGDSLMQLLVLYLLIDSTFVFFLPLKVYYIHKQFSAQLTCNILEMRVHLFYI